MIAQLAYHTAERLVRAMPGSAADRLAVLIARGAFHLRVPARRVHAANLVRLGPHLSPTAVRQITLRAFEHFALGLVDFLRLEGMDAADLRARVEVTGESHLEAARASRRGVIVLSAHLGNWEWGAAYLAARGLPIRLAARMHAGAIEPLFARRRGAFGVHRLAGGSGHAPAAGALREGAWVALMGDRAALGRTAVPVCGWAAAVAERTHSLILPAAMVRHSEARHALLVGPPLEAAAVRRGDHRALMREWLMANASQWAAFEPVPDGLA